MDKNYDFTICHTLIPYFTPKSDEMSSARIITNKTLASRYVHAGPVWIFGQGIGDVTSEERINRGSETGQVKRDCFDTALWPLQWTLG